MADSAMTIGIVGGTGMLGRAIAVALLRSGTVPPARLWLSNRSGIAASISGFSGFHVTADNQALADACSLVLLCVPPTQAGALSLHTPDRLVVSVMAGVTRDEIARLTGASRVVRAMSSPAAAIGLAFSPWLPSAAVTPGDRAAVARLFSACGATAEVPDETQIELFTSMTGPVPGFVAYFAQCMTDYATRHGIAPETADLAIRQLFLAAGRIMAEGSDRPVDHVRAMIDYAGTTAAGLEAMRASPLASSIAAGLDAAVTKTRQMR
jgi:pyrroline-5-carboxylate reductase